MAGTYSQSSRMEGSAAMSAVVLLLRKITKTPKATMRLRNLHVSKAISSNAAKAAIGKPRADIVWGCVATLIAKREHVNVDMHLRQSDIELLKVKGEAALLLRPMGQAHRVEMRGGVLAWLKENEETTRGGTYLLRPGKLTQLKAARKRTASTRGGPTAILAAIVELAAEGTVMLMETPNKPAGKGKWPNWVEDVAEWLVRMEWRSEEEAGEIREKAENLERMTERTSVTQRILNLGEGWGSIRKAVARRWPSVHVTGVDRRGFTWVGREKGHITAEVEHDWNDQRPGKDLIDTLSKKASVSAKGWALISLEPECTLFSGGNAINQAAGCAHGRWAETEVSLAAMTTERLAQEREMYREAKAGVIVQLESLERHPDIPFFAENPAGSELWVLPEVREIIDRNPGWVERQIDRCAFGREEQKPTVILTNRKDWTPRGRTGNGRCKAGSCTGSRTRSGRTKHPRQTIPGSKERRLDTGDKVKGRRELAEKAVKNALEQELVEEMFGTVLMN